MSRGHTLIEVVIAATLTGGIILLSFGVSGAIGESSSYGRRLLDTRSENQRALHFVSNDLQSASSGLDPDSGNLRFDLQDGSDVVEFVSRTAESVSRGQLAKTRAGAVDGEVVGSRPRLEQFRKNSRFVFQRVQGFTVDEFGDVAPDWSAPITYLVEGRQLIRREAGRDRVIGSNVSAFKVFAEEEGNFRVFLRTQKRNPETGEVMTVSGTIEVSPKN